MNVPFGEAGHQYFALPEPRAQSAWSGTAAAKTKFEVEISAKSKPDSETKVVKPTRHGRRPRSTKKTSTNVNTDEESED